MSLDYTVFIHLLDEEGRIVAQQDGEPFGGAYPTSVWQQGELLGDEYRLQLPASLPGGTYRVVAGLYRAGAEGGGRLPAYTETGRRFEADQVELGRFGKS